MEYDSFSEAYRALRGIAGLSNAAIARETGLSESTLSNWERGKRFPQKAADVVAVEEALSHTEGTLFALWTARKRAAALTDEQQEFFDRINQQLEEINMKLDDLLARGD